MTVRIVAEPPAFALCEQLASAPSNLVQQHPTFRLTATLPSAKRAGACSRVPSNEWMRPVRLIVRSLRLLVAVDPLDAPGTACAQILNWCDCLHRRPRRRVLHQGKARRVMT